VKRQPILPDREIGTLFLPLALTSTMMSVSVPVINAGLARVPDPQASLAAFGLAFSLSIFLESPVFALQQAMVAWYGGTGPIRRYITFASGVGFLMMAVMALVAFTPAGAFLLRTLMGAPENLIDPSLHALRVAVLFPPLVAIRLGFQGVLVSRRNSAPIAWGTLFRLVLLTALIFFVCPRLSMEPPAAAMAALAAAVFLEMFYVAHAARRTPERAPTPSPAQTVGRSLSGRILFLLPLAGTMALGTLTNPLINSFISRTADPEAGLAVYAVVASLVWFLASPTLRYSAVTIALGTSRDHLRRLSGFLWRFVGSISLVVFLIGVTPALRVLLEDVIGVPPALADRARVPMIMLSLQPLVAGFIAHNQGALTRAARTAWVGVGGVTRVVVIGVLGLLGLATGMDGALLGGILLGASFAGELVTLVAVRRLRRPVSATAVGARSGAS
jgi:hypothetical protein